MLQLCSVKYMFQSLVDSPSLKNRAEKRKKEKKAKPNSNPGAIPCCSSCSSQVLVPFIFQATHLTLCYLHPFSSAIHYRLCWYIYGQHQSSQTQMSLTSKQQCLGRNFDRPRDLPTVTPEISCRARSKTQNFHLTSWCHFDNKAPKTKHKEHRFH